MQYSDYIGFSLSGGIWLIMYNHQVSSTLANNNDMLDYFGISDVSNTLAPVSVIPSPLTSYSYSHQSFQHHNSTYEYTSSASFVYDLSQSSHTVYLFTDVSCTNMTLNSVYTQAQIVRLG
jgi:hypothetical protein